MLPRENKGKRIAIVGGGPIGLFLAIKISLRGYQVNLYERSSWPIDKVCGQGLMPRGVKELLTVGVSFEKFKDYYPFKRIEYFDEGRYIKGELPFNGMGIYRKVLSSKLFDRAQSIERIKLHEKVLVQGIGHSGKLDKPFLELSGDLNETKEFDYIFCCDGLNSSTRKKMGLDKTNLSKKRMGARIHYEVRPWSTGVQVYWNDGIEAYVTPVNEGQVEIAFLWFEEKVEKGPRLKERLFEKFPVLMDKISEANSLNDFKGYGPFSRSSKKINEKGIFFVGDAYCFGDGITGEGLSLGLQSASLISRCFENFTAKDKLKIKVLYMGYLFWIYVALSFSRLVTFRRFIFSVLKNFPKLFNRILQMSSNS